MPRGGDRYLGEKQAEISKLHARSLLWSPCLAPTFTRRLLVRTWQCWWNHLFTFSPGQFVILRIHPCVLLPDPSPPPLTSSVSTPPRIVHRVHPTTPGSDHQQHQSLTQLAKVRRLSFLPFLTLFIAYIKLAISFHRTGHLRKLQLTNCQCRNPPFSYIVKTHFSLTKLEWISRMYWTSSFKFNVKNATFSLSTHFEWMAIHSYGWVCLLE